MDVASYLDQPHVVPEYRAVENPARLRLYEQATSVRNADEALQAVMSESFDINRDLVIEIEGGDVPAGGGGVIRSWTRMDPNTLHVEVDSQQGTWLMVSEAWYPGWRVRIDDRDSELYHADHLFMGVWIDPGEHRIEFRYEPWSIGAGLVISLFSLLILLGLYFRWARD